MQVAGEPRSGSSTSLAGRITITVLLLVLPLSCLLLAVTASRDLAGGWYLLAAVNAVLPAVMLPFVWRRPEDAPSDAG